MEFDRQLADLLSEFAHTLATDFSIQAILDQLVVRIVDVLPITAAGVTLITPGATPLHVASNEEALQFARLQSELGEGPSHTAYETGKAVAVPDLRTDPRFPTFAPRAVETGLMSVFTFPICHGDHQLGALDMLCDTTGPMDAGAMMAAHTLADVAAAYLLNAQARADLRESSERAQENLLHDAMTGLPNRTLLVQRLDHAILRCQRSDKIVAILFVDLDQFKSINDTYGHQVGDRLLVAVADRLTETLRAGDTVARLGGDEFVILCEDLDETSQGSQLAARIGSALAQPFTLTDVEVQVSASVGIAFAGRGDYGSEQALQVADTAMYQAKRKGGARHATVDLREQRLANHRATLSRDLRGALSRGELRTEYQPIVATSDGRITGVEALLRWTHPVHGNVGPQTAVPLAERAGLIAEIGLWVLERACLDRQQWPHDDYPHGLEIAVNVSAYQLMAPDFPAAVAAVLEETQTDPALVTLEVTESVFLRDGERAIVALNDLKEIGVMLALDDFGTGYSSLSYLKQFPVDVVKIDRVFISDLDRNPDSRLIVNAVVALAHGLCMWVVAEGIESVDQYKEVAELDCDSCQGFYFARPASAETIGTLLSGRSATVSLPLRI